REARRRARGRLVRRPEAEAAHPRLRAALHRPARGLARPARRRDDGRDRPRRRLRGEARVAQSLAQPRGRGRHRPSRDDPRRRPLPVRPGALSRGRRPPSLIGRTLGGYTVQRLLGTGGMGAVYEARDEKLKRPVALKVIRWDTTPDPEAANRLVKRFLREARAL